MKRLFLATALLAALGACMSSHPSNNGPARNTDSQQGSYANPAQSPASQGQTGVYTGPQPGGGR